MLYEDDDDAAAVLDDTIQSEAAKLLCTLKPTEFLALPWVTYLADDHNIAVVPFEDIERGAASVLPVTGRGTLVYCNWSRHAAWFLFVPHGEVSARNRMFLFTQPLDLAWEEKDTEIVLEATGLQHAPEGSVLRIQKSNVISERLRVALAQTRFNQCGSEAILTFVLAKLCTIRDDDFYKAIMETNSLMPAFLTSALYTLAVLIAKHSVLPPGDIDAHGALNDVAERYLHPDLFYEDVASEGGKVQAKPRARDPVKKRQARVRSKSIGPPAAAAPPATRKGGFDTAPTRSSRASIVEPAVGAGVRAGAGARAGAGGFIHDDADDDDDGGLLALVIPEHAALTLPAVWDTAGAQRGFAVRSADMRHRVQDLIAARAALLPFAERQWHNASRHWPATNVYLAQEALIGTATRPALLPAAVLGKGMYGTSRAVYVYHPTVDAEADGGIILAATKTLPVYATQTTAAPCTTLNRTSQELTYIGNRAIGREAVFASALTRLVLACNTPHFCMTYDMLPHTEPTEKEAQYHVEMLLQVMELVEMDLYGLLTQWLLPLSSPRALEVQPAAMRLQLINVLVFQVLQALVVARTKLGFRHNDLHSRNVRLTRAAPAVWQYTVPAAPGGPSEFQTWRVPNAGVCVKLIDFGMATSTRLFGHQDHELFEHGMLEGDYIALFHADADETHLQMAAAAELQDATHVLKYMLAYGRPTSTAAMRHRLREGMRMCVKLTRACPNPYVRLGIAQTRRQNHEPVTTNAARAIHAQFGVRDHGLLHQFLHWWATTSGFEATAPSSVTLADLTRPDDTCAGSGVWDVRRPLALAQAVAPQAVFETHYFFSPGGDVSLGDKLNVIDACPSRDDAAAEARRMQRYRVIEDGY